MNCDDENCFPFPESISLRETRGIRTIGSKSLEILQGTARRESRFERPFRLRDLQRRLEQEC